MSLVIISCLLFHILPSVETFSGKSPFVQFTALRTRAALEMLPKSTKEILSENFSRVLAISTLGTMTIARTVFADNEKILSPEITHKVYLDIKIANYTEESVGTNKGAKGSGQVVFGLYGKDAPDSVKLFLSLVDSDGISSPDYYGSQFTRVVDGQLLEMDKVRGISPISIGGTDALEFKGNILPYKPIVETNSIRHDRAGLLTRRQLAAGPEFGITLAPAPSLDTLHLVFGRIIEGSEVLEAISNIRTYSYKTTTGYVGQRKENEPMEGGIADKWFEGQKELFVGLGKSFGDQRAVDQRGKLLRR